MTTTEFLKEIKGCTVEDEMGVCWRVEDLRGVRALTGYTEFSIGLQKLGHGETQPLVYVGLDRYDQMTSYTPFN